MLAQQPTEAMDRRSDASETQQMPEDRMCRGDDRLAGRQLAIWPIARMPSSRAIAIICSGELPVGNQHPGEMDANPVGHDPRIPFFDHDVDLGTITPSRIACVMLASCGASSNSPIV
jgi:hypothetical protein